MATNLDYYICIDIESGTFFSASTTYILDTRRLSPEQLELLNEGCDDDRSDIAASHGTCLEDIIAPHTLQP